MSSIHPNVGAEKKECAVDTLQSSIPLPYQELFFPHGFPVVVKSNDAVVITAAEVSWRGFQQRFDVPPLEVRFVITESSATRRRPPVPVFRAQSNLMSM